MLCIWIGIAVGLGGGGWVAGCGDLWWWDVMVVMVVVVVVVVWEKLECSTKMLWCTEKLICIIRKKKVY